jgi:hypothetical protein
VSRDSERIRTRHGELSLEEVAEALPGTAETMAAVGRCYSACWHAAHGGNWELSAYYFRRTRNLLRNLAVRRPKYAEQLARFDVEALTPLLVTIDARDLSTFDAAHARGIDSANEYHVETGHPYIRWLLPDRPPEGLDLNP